MKKALLKIEPIFYLLTWAGIFISIIEEDYSAATLFMNFLIIHRIYKPSFIN